MMSKFALKEYNFSLIPFKHQKLLDALSKKQASGNVSSLFNASTEEMVTKLEKACKNFQIGKKYFTALRKFDRAHFIGWKHLSEEEKIQLGSSPYTFSYCSSLLNTTVPSTDNLLFKLFLLQIKSDQSILEVGTGSGYTTCFLAELGGKNTKVYSTEIYPKIINHAQKIFSKYSLTNRISIKFAGAGEDPQKQNAPYDRIFSLLSIHSRTQLKELVSHLKVGGIALVPIMRFHDEVEILPDAVDKRKNLPTSGKFFFKGKMRPYYFIDAIFKRVSKNKIEYSFFSMK